MTTIYIGMTQCAMEAVATRFFEYSNAMSKIKQHKIILSETIITEYRKHFANIDSIDLFDRWLADFLRYDFSEMVESVEACSFIEILKKTLSNKNPWTIIDLKRSETRDQKVVFLEDIEKNDCSSIFSRYCIPADFIIYRTETKQDFLKWLKISLCTEKRITIIDKYICSNWHNIELLKNTYIPVFPRDAKIEIYFNYEDYNKNKDDIELLLARYKERVILHPSEPKGMHDRYILLSDFSISIGHGLDFIWDKKDYVMHETEIHVTKNRPNIPKVHSI